MRMSSWSTCAIKLIRSGGQEMLGIDEWRNHSGRSFPSSVASKYKWRKKITRRPETERIPLCHRVRQGRCIAIARQTAISFPSDIITRCVSLMSCVSHVRLHRLMAFFPSNVLDFVVQSLDFILFIWKEWMILYVSLFSSACNCSCRWFPSWFPISNRDATSSCCCWLPRLMVAQLEPQSATQQGRSATTVRYASVDVWSALFLLSSSSKVEIRWRVLFQFVKLLDIPGISKWQRFDQQSFFCWNFRFFLFEIWNAEN